MSGAMFRVIDESGHEHEARVVVGEDGRTAASIGDESLTFSEGPSPRVAALRIAAWCRIEAAEVLAQGQPSAAELTHAMFEKMSRLIEHERGVAVAALEDARMCLAARDAASAGMAWQSVAIEAGDGVAAARAAEVAHLEARRGALLAEVDRLTARDRDAGVVIEDLRKMLAGASVDLAAARDDAAQARLDGAREMRELTAAVAQEAGGRLTPAEIRALPLTGGAQ